MKRAEEIIERMLREKTGDTYTLHAIEKLNAYELRAIVREVLDQNAKIENGM